MNHPKKTLLLLGALIWFGAGSMLLLKGLYLLIESSQAPLFQQWIIAKLSPIAGGNEQAALVLVSIGLFIGFIKGRLVLERSAKRVVESLSLLGEKAKLKDLFTVRYLFLIALMMLLGRMMTWLQIDHALRGTIDVAVGSALIHGSMYLFRTIIERRKKKVAG